MTKQVGVYDPATAKMVLEVVRYLRQSGYVITRPGRGDQNIAPPTPIYVRNDSGEAIPPFACMQTTGTVEAGGQNYITVDKPADTDGASGAYLFNGVAEIEIGGYGVAHDGPVVRMLTDGTSPSSGEQWTPVAGEWAVEPGAGPFIAIGGDDIATDVMRGRIGGGGSGGGTLYRFMLIGSLSSGSIGATFYDMETGDEVDFGSIYDPEGIFAELDDGDRGLAIKQGGRYYVIQAHCPDEGD